MAEQKKGFTPGGLIRRVFQALLALLLMAAVYIGLTLLQMPGESRADSFVVVEENEPVTRMQSTTTSDAASLARLFGAPLPYLPGTAVVGAGGNTDHDGGLVRAASLTYDGVRITAVQPASAAPLLLYEGLSVQAQGGVIVLSQPAMVAGRGDAFCAYFSSGNTAYAVYAASTSQEEFLQTLSRLSWAQ